MSLALALFGPSELSRFRDRFPERDVDAVAERVARRHSTAGYRNPVAVLMAALKASEREDRDRIGGDDGVSVTDGRPLGGFDLDGSWNPEADGRDEFTRWIWRTARIIDTQRLAPFTVMAMILDSGFADRFSPVVTNPDDGDGWACLEYAKWPMVPCRRSCEEALKRRGTGGYVSWENMLGYASAP